jgi:hypothetical protein
MRIWQGRKQDVMLCCDLTSHRPSHQEKNIYQFTRNTSISIFREQIRFSSSTSWTLKAYGHFTSRITFPSLLKLTTVLTAPRQGSVFSWRNSQADSLHTNCIYRNCNQIIVSALFNCPHFGFLAMPSTKLDNICCNKFEEILFRWSLHITFLQILSNPHLSLNVSRSCHLLKSEVAILDFWQCCLLNMTKYLETNLKKHCSVGWHEQLFFKYFPIHNLVFEKTWADDVVCSNLGLNDLGQIQ